MKSQIHAPLVLLWDDLNPEALLRSLLGAFFTKYQPAHAHILCTWYSQLHPAATVSTAIASLQNTQQFMFCFFPLFLHFPTQLFLSPTS